MDERDLQVFIDSAVHYFGQMCGEQADTGTPYLMENSETLAYTFTGIIGISGKSRGCVYFTAPEILLKHLLIGIGEPDTSRDSMCDIVGEIANTIAGNARSHFGPDFMISVPTVIDDHPERIHLPESLRSFVVPVTWRRQEAAVVISIE